MTTAIRIAVALVASGALAPPAWAQPPVPWQDLSPRQRERAIENYQHYRELPKNQRQQLDERSRRFEQLPSQERQRLRQSYEQYQRLGPGQRQQLEQRYQQWQKKQGQQGKHGKPNR